MKKIIFISLLLSPGLALAQIDDLLKKTTVPELLEEKNVTSSITDAYPEAFWLRDIGDWIDPVEPTDYSFNLAPGYYTFTLQTYCLKAGSHGPTKGSGYLIAPLLGKRADLVANILKRSANHPVIAQQDIQLLLWAIIYGAKFTELEPGLQTRVRPLLTEAEIADLSIGIKDIPLELLPSDLRQTAQFYKDLRSKLTNPASSFEEIEQTAVLTGEPPSSMLLKDVKPGNWAYIGGGFYARIFPEWYSKSVVEIYRPAVVNIQRDNLNRIISLEQDGSRLEVSYQDEEGSDVMQSGGKYYPIYRFKSLKLTGTNPGEELVIENTGWIIRGDGKEIKNPLAFKNYPQDPSLSEYQSRLKEAKDFSKMMSSYKKEFKNRPTGGSESRTTDEFDADKHMRDGLKVALNPQNKKGQASWLRKHFGFVQDWWGGASDALSGGKGAQNNDPKRAGIENFTGAPGNTGEQRIGISSRAYR